jgi:MFS family permease
MNVEIQKHLRHNLVVNLLDGGFFGFALGFTSFVTVIPLFVSTMTDSAILIGLIPAIHSAGWNLPQLLMANRVSRQKTYKPMVLTLTIQERWPYLALAAVAWFAPQLGVQTALWLTFGLLTWQALGGGFMATAWQSMIGKIFPNEIRGTFYGAQASAANLLASVSAVLAGMILGKLISPNDFTLCFVLAFISMMVSWVFLAMTREPEYTPAEFAASPGHFWSNLGAILRGNRNFRWFLSGRMVAQLAVMAFAFYTVYAVEELGASEVQVGWMTGVLLATQIVANTAMGWLGDRWSRRSVLVIGMAASTLSALLAWLAPEASWFFAAFALAGVANVAVWTISLTMILDFGSEAERPAYIGLANTLVAPANILAPFLGGWLAEQAGYPAAFMASAIGGVAAILIFQLGMREPARLEQQREPGLVSEPAEGQGHS